MSIKEGYQKVARRYIVSAGKSNEIQESAGFLAYHAFESIEEQ